MYWVGIDLKQGEPLLGSEPDRTRETAAILLHTFGRVPGNVAEIESTIGESAYSSMASGESVMQVRQFFKSATAVVRLSACHPPDKSVFIHASNIEACLCLVPTRFRSIA
jgi:hypothetical protein